MKVLIACEYSGIVRDAFTSKGHDAWSCDILPTESPGNHFQGDVLEHLDKGWDLMIAHPPCTHLAVSGARWFTEGRKPWSLQIKALDFVRKLLAAPINKIALENPVSVISTKIRKPNQAIILRAPNDELLEFQKNDSYLTDGFTITMWVRFVSRSSEGTLFNFGNPLESDGIGFRLDTKTNVLNEKYY